MGISQSSTRLVLWAAQDGRTGDLLYHLQDVKPESLKGSSLAPHRRSAIHLAAERGNTECVKLLRQAGSELDRCADDGYSPVHLAVSNGHYQTMLMLLHLGANVNNRARFDVTPLHIAASTGHTSCIEALVKCLANIDAQESWGQTPLIIATRSSRIPCMRLLIGLGADLEVKDHHNRMTALHVACTTKDEETLLTLLDAGVDLSAVDSKGQGPVGVALENKFYYAVPLLLEYGARKTQRDREGMSPVLERHLDHMEASPRSLLRQCRVRLRQALGPVSLNEQECLSSLDLDETLQDYVCSIRGVCEAGAEVKRLSLLEALVEHRKEMLLKQSEHPLVPLSPSKNAMQFSAYVA